MLILPLCFGCFYPQVDVGKYASHGRRGDAVALRRDYSANFLKFLDVESCACQQVGDVVQGYPESARDGRVTELDAKHVVFLPCFAHLIPVFA